MRHRLVSLEPDVAPEDEGQKGSAVTEIRGTRLVGKALNLIDLIAASPGEHRAQTLADELGVPRSTVYRIINTLQQRGLVRVEASGQGYFPGFRFLEYAQAVWPMPDLPMLAMTEIRWLHELSGETVYFAAPGGTNMIIIQKIMSLYPISTGAPLGSLRPLYCSGMGKAHLAALAPAEREALIGRMSFERVTDRTITDPAQLRSQLDVFRQRGYAIDDEEFMEGVRCVSAAVPGEGDVPLGAFTVSGPCYRMTLERVHQLGPEVATAARRLGEAVRRQGGVRPRARPDGAEVPLAAIGRSFLGKSPSWDAETGSLLWLDALAPAIMRAGAGESGAPSRSEVMAKFTAPAMALTPIGEGRWFVATEKGAMTVDRNAHFASLDPPLPLELLAGISSACHGPDGQIWFGTGETSSSPAGPGLYRLAAGKPVLEAELPAAATDILIDPVGHHLYAALRAAGEIIRVRIAPDGKCAGQELVARVDAIHGRPMALALEEPDHLWVALWDGWSLARLRRDGSDMRLLSLPVPRPTGLAFGGQGGDLLYVTSGRIGLTPQQIAEAPASGSVFALDRRLRAALLR
ncbi:IclR family transcriptional regulator C-terminal domain-containing protein [Bosea sp. BIWAKO-01]|uniref:IclR family transcriptional regulator domain-containing protein n=1 Tax=Bosea sp. BIWAKO-01 TaxID=506668 RepID=UPI000853828E|nr:IclR family transcriptional regulator C-terminal domain-containing protein [Bosea sp. BIWAKO-01]GAU87013.1 transcriptional regulator of IclR family [Bosea sp. BIWAKO-01]